MTRTVLFSAVKNEAPFLLEWIAYHKAIGFGRIVIFSNDSEDGTTELLEALAKAGEIEHFPHQVPEGASPQGNAARIANEAGLIGKGDWVLWLDADEFLAINTGNGLLENLIAALGDKIALLIPWRVFGDGGNERFPGRFVSPDFASCSRRKFPGNFEAKTLFRMGREFAGLAQSGIHRPLVARGARIDPERIVTASGSGLDLAEPVNSKWLAGEDFPKSRLVSKSEHGYRMAQINHYCVRTPEHFVLKRMRGRGWAVAQAGEANIRHTAGFYRKMNRNDVEDRLILRFEDQTIQAAEDLRNHPEVARAEARARELVAAQVARVSAAEIAELAAPPPPPSRAEFPLSIPAEQVELLGAHYRQAGAVLEYGSGGSTMLALQSGAKHVFSVESDARWARRLARAIAAEFPERHCIVHHVDIGPTGKWGRATDASGVLNYHKYPAEIWDHPEFVHPDIVLIDGRFRSACFLTVLMRCTRPVTVLFDDYADRPEYHWLEEFVRPQELHGRMARFVVEPTPFPVHRLTPILGAFADQS